jgi:long-chain acyl-CoA synthetase
MSTQQLFLGIISGERKRDHAEIADRAARMAGGLQRLGVRRGDSVCILMRNDVAFIEAAYAAMRLGAYAVPVNWHFKPEEIDYVLKDSGTSVLVGHADMLHPLRDAIPAGVTVLSAPTPPEILKSYKIDPDLLASPDFAVDLECWLELQRPYDGPTLPQPQNMIYTSGTTGHPKGVRRNAPTPEQTIASERLRALIYGMKPGVRALLPGPLYHSAPNSFGLRSGASRRRAGADAAVRSRGISAADSRREDRHHLHGADHVHPAAEAAKGSARKI